MANEKHLRETGRFNELVDYEDEGEREDEENSRDGVIRKGGTLSEANAAEGLSAKQKRDGQSVCFSFFGLIIGHRHRGRRYKTS